MYCNTRNSRNNYRKFCEFWKAHQLIAIRYIASCHWSSSQQAKKKVDGSPGQNERPAPRRVREVKLSECQNSVRLLGPAPNHNLPTPSQSELVGLERHLMRWPSAQTRKWRGRVEVGAVWNQVNMRPAHTADLFFTHTHVLSSIRLVPSCPMDKDNSFNVFKRSKYNFLFKCR